MARTSAPLLTIVITPEQLTLLEKLDFPCSKDVLTSARSTEEGLELSGSRVDFDSLVGWVAGEANHSRRGSRRAELLNDIADELEFALEAHHRP